MGTKALLVCGSGLVALATLSVVSVAQTVSNSPFANSGPKAWEQAPTYPTSSQVPAPTQYGAPATQQGGIVYGGPASPASTQSPTISSPSSGGNYYSGSQSQSTGTGASQSWGGQTYTQTAPTPSYSAPSYEPSSGQNYAQPYPQSGQSNYGGQYYPQNAQAGRGTNTGANGQIPQNQSWANRSGFSNLQTSLDGQARIGGAYVDGAGNDFVGAADFDIRGEISGITGGGLEYGAGLRGRAQYDKFRRGFGGLVGNCPAADPACASVNVAGNDRAIKGYTGQFYTDGNPDISETQAQLEGAYVFLRSAYGTVTAGRDDGSAYLFSLGAPSLVMVSASNSPVDYTGLDSVITKNNASGFSEKIRYTSPRLLGDTVGVGVQLGVSYAFDGTACGVDYCVEDNTASALDPFAPQMDDIIEVGLALDRTFNSGLSAELTGTYARGSESTGFAAFEDLSSWGAGLELGYGDWTFGTSYLNSNNGIATGGNYKAYDAGLTWQPGRLGITAGYGHADDDLAGLSSNQGVLALSYDLDTQFGEFRVGTGVQYIDRTVSDFVMGARTSRDEDAIAGFIEAGITF